MNRVQLTYRRVLHALDTHGLGGLWRQAMVKLRDRRAGRSPGAAGSLGQHPFDVAHGVDTGGFVHGEALAAGHAADVYATAYYGISPSALALALGHVAETGLDHREFTFIDLGAGKGRALLVASQYPFRKIVGVELSAELCAIARENTVQFSADWWVGDRFEIVQADAAAFAFPETPLVIFLYHPFLGKVLRKVLRNLEDSVRRSPREVYLLYANPTYDEVMARYPFLVKQWFYLLPLSAEDAAADRHDIQEERFALYRHIPAKK